MSRQPPAVALHLLAEERRGEFDGYLADRAVAAIRRELERRGGAVSALGYHGADCDADTLADAIETPSLFGARTLVVLRGAEALGERAQTRLGAALERQAPQVTVVIVARGADMRRRFFARCRELGRRVAVDHPRAGEMPAWADRLAAERGRRLDPVARELLLDGVGRDLLLLAGELDKLAAAVPSTRVITAADVASITAGGRAHGAFEVVDALCRRDLAGTLRLLAQSLDEGVQPIAVVGALTSSLKMLAAGADRVARGASIETAGREIGIAFYQRRAFEQGVRAYRGRELRGALARLAVLDVAIKTGACMPRALLETWVLELCRRGPAAPVRARSLAPP